MKTKTKKAGVLWFVLFFFPIGNLVQAQPNGHQGTPPIPNANQISKMVTDLSKALSLSEEQGSRIEQIFVFHFEEVKEKMDAGKPDRKAMEAMRTKFENEVNGLLTEEQQKLFVAFREKNEPPHKERHERSKE
ncbi:MAG TPA: hypothetical protein VLA03_08210 [Draconibacterium sp.]|nr:hypothetical protein [Draconibacterium sp.]